MKFWPYVLLKHQSGNAFLILATVSFQVVFNDLVASPTERTLFTVCSDMGKQQERKLLAVS